MGIVVIAYLVLSFKDACKSHQKMDWRKLMHNINGFSLQEALVQMELRPYLLRRLARLGVSRSEVDGFSFEQLTNLLKERMKLLLQVYRYRWRYDLPMEPGYPLLGLKETEWSCEAFASQVAAFVYPKFKTMGERRLA